MASRHLHYALCAFAGASLASAVMIAVSHDPHMILVAAVICTIVTVATIVASASLICRRITRAQDDIKAYFRRGLIAESAEELLRRDG